MVYCNLENNHSTLVVPEGRLGDTCTVFPDHRLIVTYNIVHWLPGVSLNIQHDYGKQEHI